MSNYANFANFNVPKNNNDNNPKSKITTMLQKKKEVPIKKPTPALSEKDKVPHIELSVKLQQLAAEESAHAKEAAKTCEKMETLAKKMDFKDLRPAVSEEFMKTMEDTEHDSWFLLRMKLKGALIMYRAAMDHAANATELKETAAALERAQKEAIDCREEAAKCREETKKAKAQYTLVQREFEGYKANMIKLNDDLNTKDELIEALQSELNQKKEESQKASNEINERRNSDLIKELEDDLAQPPEKNDDLLGRLMVEPEIGSTPNQKKKAGLKRIRKAGKTPSPKKQATALTELPSSQTDLFGTDFTSSQYDEIL